MKQLKMKAMQGLLLILTLLGSLSTGSGQAPKKIGSFSSDGYPVYLIGYIVQASPDGNFLMFRGGNFQNHDLMKTDPEVPNFSNWMQNPTDGAGLYLPPSDALPSIPGWDVCYCYDVKYNVTGHGLCRDWLDYSAYKNDPNLRLFKTQKAAEKEIVTKPTTGPVGTIPPPVTSGSIGLVADFYPFVSADQRDYFELAKQMPGTTEFNYYGNPGITYPAISDADSYSSLLASRPDLILIHLPSHSTTTGEVGVKQWKLPAYAEMTLTDSDGNLIWSMKDYKGGFHPKDTGINNRRGNNHPWYCSRYIKKGNYTACLSNVSKDSRAVEEFEFARDGQVVARASVPVGETRCFEVDLTTAQSWAKINDNFVNP